MSIWTTALARRWLRVGVHLAAALPLLAIAGEIFLKPEQLGANPVATVTDQLGLWALRLLLGCLALTPARILSRSAEWLRYRRALGLWAACYALLHLLMYAVVDQHLDWPTLWTDVLKRRWITVGFAAVVLLAVLSATSTAGMMRRLGRQWQRLHRSVYLAAGLALWHYLWQVKKDLRAPLAYCAVFALLLLVRLLRRRLTARSAPATAPGRT